MKLLYIYHISGVATIDENLADIHGIFECHHKLLCNEDYLELIKDISNSLNGKPPTEKIIIKSLTFLGERSE